MGVSECLCEGKNTECDCQWVNLLMGSILCLCVWGCVRWKDEPERSVCVCDFLWENVKDKKWLVRNRIFLFVWRKMKLTNGSIADKTSFGQSCSRKEHSMFYIQRLGSFVAGIKRRRCSLERHFLILHEKTRFLFFSTKHFVNFSPTIWTVLIERKKVFLISDLL